MKKRDIVSIGQIYGNTLNNLRKNLKESTSPKTFGGEKSTKLVGKGPVVDGVNEPDDNCDCVGKCKCLNNEEDEEEIMKETRKNISPVVNKHMSDSLFDKLLDKVLTENFGQDQERDDLDALGLDDSTPDASLDDDFGGDDDLGEDGDSVTFTLDRTVAQQLVDVLQGVLGEGGEDDDMDFGGEDDDMDFGGEDDDMDFEEDEETEGGKGRLQGNSKLQGKSNKVGGPGVQPGSQSASSDVTDEQGTKTNTPSIDGLKGKNNQVPGSRLAANKDYFKV